MRLQCAQRAPRGPFFRLRQTQRWTLAKFFRRSCSLAKLDALNSPTALTTAEVWAKRSLASPGRRSPAAASGLGSPPRNASHTAPCIAPSKSRPCCGRTAVRWLAGVCAAAGWCQPRTFPVPKLRPHWLRCWRTRIEAAVSMRASKKTVRLVARYQHGSTSTPLRQVGTKAPGSSTRCLSQL